MTKKEFTNVIKNFVTYYPEQIVEDITEGLKHLVLPDNINEEEFEEVWEDMEKRGTLEIVILNCVRTVIEEDLKKRIEKNMLKNFCDPS